MKILPDGVVILYLVGFMGAGKSTTAKALAERLGWRVLDMDELIEKREKRIIREIFSKKGINYFRGIEKLVLQKKIARRKRVVVSTGGGSFMSYDNRRCMLDTGIVVWLDVSFRESLRRLNGSNNRPLAQSRSKLLVRFRMRRPYYGWAHITVKVRANRSVEEIVEEIVNKVNQWVNRIPLVSTTC